MEGGIEVLEAAVPILEAARRALTAPHPTCDDAIALRTADRQWPEIASALNRVRRERGAEKLIAQIDSLDRKILKRVGGDRSALLSKLPRGTLPPGASETRIDEEVTDDGSLGFGIVSAALVISFALTAIWWFLLPLAVVLLTWRSARRNRKPPRWAMLTDRLFFEGRDYPTSRLKMLSATVDLVVVDLNGDRKILSTSGARRLGAVMTLLSDAWLQNLDSRPAPHSIDGNTLRVEQGRLTVTNPPFEANAYLFILAHVPGARWHVLGPHLAEAGAKWEPT